MSETPEQPINAPVAPVSAPVVAIDASNQHKKLKEIYGRKIDQSIIDVINAQIAAKEEEVRDPGDSLLTATTLPGGLPQMEKGEQISENSGTQNSTFGEKVTARMESRFESISELSPTSAAKWHEVFETLFENYEYSQKILTTKDYGKADLNNCKVAWKLLKLKGDFNILNASATLDEQIVTFLKGHNLLECLSEKQLITTRDVWAEINTLVEATHLEPYEEYLDSSTRILSDLSRDTVEDVLNSFVSQKQVKYDSNMIEFIESQGFPFPLQVIWMFLGKTAMGKVILKTLEAHHKEYRKNPTPIKGMLTFLEKIKKTAAWKEGSTEKGCTEHRSKASTEIQQRRNPATQKEK